MAVEACRLRHISTVSATTSNSMARECRDVRFFLCMRVLVCVEAVKSKSGCTKGMADPVLHGVSFHKLEQSDWPSSLQTDLNFMTIAGNYLHIHSSSV